MPTVSRSAGTGSPVWFRCYLDRKGIYDAGGHRVQLTGNTRPYHPKHRHCLGSRSTTTSYEYRCSCSHVGWSNHIDLARLAGDAR